MSPQLLAALQITLLGMGLVFFAILLLWLVIFLLVRATSNRQAIKAEISRELIQRAAAAAVAVILEKERQPEVHEFPLPPTPLVSAWQVVMRSGMLKKWGRLR